MGGLWDRKRGKPRSEEIRRKISAAKTGKAPTAALIAEDQRRKGLAPSKRATAANKARRGREDTVANARANGLAGRGKSKSEHMRVALGRAKTGTTHSAEARQKMSDSQRKWWDNVTDEERAARPYPHAPFKTMNTYIEHAVAAVLLELGEKFDQHRRMGGRWEPDFYLPERNLLIEADGWHYTQPAAVARDARKNKWAVAAGFVIARLGSKVIQADARGCVAAVLEEVASDASPGIITIGEAIGMASCRHLPVPLPRIEPMLAHTRTTGRDAVEWSIEPKLDG